MDAILETGLACVVPPLAVVVVSFAIGLLMTLINKKVIKD